MAKLTCKIYSASTGKKKTCMKQWKCNHTPKIYNVVHSFGSG